MDVAQTSSSVAARDRPPEDVLLALRENVWGQRRLIFFRLLPLLALSWLLGSLVVTEGGFLRSLLAALPGLALTVMAAVRVHQARAAARTIAADYVFDRKGILAVDRAAVAVRVLPAIAIGVALGLLAGSWVRPPRSTLTPSVWYGAMEFQADSYPFRLDITGVDAAGRVTGSMFWFSSAAARRITGHAIGGDADNGAGDILELDDNDGDHKSLVVKDGVMTGTDKNGRATLRAERVDHRSPFSGRLRSGEIPLDFVVKANDLLGKPACGDWRVRVGTAVVDVQGDRVGVLTPWDIINGGSGCGVDFAVELVDDHGVSEGGIMLGHSARPVLETLSGNAFALRKELAPGTAGMTVIVRSPHHISLRHFDVRGLAVAP